MTARGLIGASLALVFTAPVAAAERSISIGDFDRIRVEGAFTVSITTARATSARVSGTQGAVEATRVTVEGRTLVVRRDRQVWGSAALRDTGSSTVRITAPTLQSAWVRGPAMLSIDTLRGARLSLSLEGSGRIAVARVEGERLDVGLIGAGTIMLSGSIKDFGALVRGSGTLDAAALTASDAKITSESAGELTLAVKRAVTITTSGAGNVTIGGTPACTVTNTGSGAVVCGSEKPQRR